MNPARHSSSGPDAVPGPVTVSFASAPAQVAPAGRTSARMIPPGLTWLAQAGGTSSNATVTISLS